MADETYYAWTPIVSGKTGDVTGDKTAIHHVRVKVGDEVSPELLGIDDVEFEELIRSGAVRPMEFPQLPPDYQDSPINYMKRAVRALEDNISTVGGTGFNERLLRRTLSGRLDTPDPEEVDTETETQPATFQL